jgi:undecaprenyl diphosphate synthase
MSLLTDFLAPVEDYTVPSQSAWQYVVSSSYNQHYDNEDYTFAGFLDDNSSLQCPAQFTCTQDASKDLLVKILRWVKLIVLKLARSYYALPILLVALPLLMGVTIGFIMGRKYEQGSKRKDTYLWTKATKWCADSWLFGRLLRATLSQDCPTDVSARLLESVLCKVGLTNQITTRTHTSCGSLIEAMSETDEKLTQREELARAELCSREETMRESGIPLEDIPKHVAIIMDGNRRYGTKKYGNATSGHWDGSRKVLQVAKWCIAEQIQCLTVYAFSTENWRRDPKEVASLMSLFSKYCEELRVEAIERNIRVRVLSTETNQIPRHVKAAFSRLENDTAHCAGGLEMNICLSYGSRGEIVRACQGLAQNCVDGSLKPSQISDERFQKALLTGQCVSDPDVLIRTSGEMRLSNFLLYQLAYTELFFLNIMWPAFEKDDFLKVIKAYAKGRQRRYGT